MIRKIIRQVVYIYISTERTYREKMYLENSMLCIVKSKHNMFE